MEPLGTARGSSDATNQSVREPDVVVCPKIPPPQTPTVIETLPAPTKAAKKKRAEKARKAAPEAPPHDPSSGSMASNGLILGSDIAPCPSVDGPQCEVTSLVSEAHVDQSKRVVALRKLLRKHRRPVGVQPEWVELVEPHVVDYGGFFQKSMSQYKIDMEAYDVAVDKRAKLFHDFEVNGKHNNLIAGDHFLVCNDECVCDARKDPRYLALLMAYTSKQGGSGDAVVKRQRQARGPGKPSSSD